MILNVLAKIHYFMWMFDGADVSKGTQTITNVIGLLGKLVALFGGVYAVWGLINIFEGYGNDNPGAKAQGMKQLVGGIAIIIVALVGFSYITDMIPDL